MTEKQLRDKVWFWRKWVNGDPTQHFKTLFPFRYYWPGRHERVVFQYELVRRANRKLKLTSFPSLEGYQDGLVHIFDVSLMPQLPSRDCRDPKQQAERGWSAPTPYLQWNLSLPDHTLVKAFRTGLELARKAQGVPQPSRTLREPRRRIPWRWLELLDLAEAQTKHRFTAGERHSLSTARKAATKHSKAFFVGLDMVCPPIVEAEKNKPASLLGGVARRGSEEGSFAWRPPSPHSFLATNFKLWNRQWPCE